MADPPDREWSDDHRLFSAQDTLKCFGGIVSIQAGYGGQETEDDPPYERSIKLISLWADQYYVEGIKLIVKLFTVFK